MEEHIERGGLFDPATFWHEAWPLVEIRVSEESVRVFGLTRRWRWEYRDVHLARRRYLLLPCVEIRNRRDGSETGVWFVPVSYAKLVQAFGRYGYDISTI